MNPTGIHNRRLIAPNYDRWSDFYRRISTVTSKLQMLKLAMEGRGGEYQDDMMFPLEDCICELTHNMTELRDQMDDPDIVAITSA